MDIDIRTIIFFIEIMIILILFVSYKRKKKSYKNRCSKCGKENSMSDYDKEVVGHYYTNIYNRKKTHVDNVYKRYRKCKYCGHEDARVYVGYDFLQRLH